MNDNTNQEEGRDLTQSTHALTTHSKFGNSLNCDPGQESKNYETLASDALERIAQRLGISIDFDDPEQVVISAVERAITALVARPDPASRRDDAASGSPGATHTGSRTNRRHPS